MPTLEAFRTKTAGALHLCFSLLPPPGETSPRKAMLRLIKRKLRYTYPLLILFGLLVGPIGLLTGLPTLAAMGNAAFLAGFFTPVLMSRKLSRKDALFGGIWCSTVAYFVSTGDVDGAVLFATIPLLLASIAISKWSGVSFNKLPDRLNNCSRKR